MNCKFTLLRYVPDIVKGEFMNLGVALMDQGGRVLGARMFGEEELRRVRCLHPTADLEMLRELQSGFAREIAGLVSRGSLDKLRDTLSNSLTLVEPKLCITEDWRAELEALYRRYVAAPPRAGRETENPRQQLRHRLEQRFRLEGLLERLQPFRAAPFTVAGDPFRIDYSYAPSANGRRKYIHAITLERATHQAKVLAFTFEHIRRARRSDEMTAVSEDSSVQPAPGHTETKLEQLVSAGERARLTRELLESSGIRVRPFSELNLLVREIREDLALGLR